jgi:hypothetical protein
MSADVDIFRGERTFTGIIYAEITAVVKGRTDVFVVMSLTVLPNISIILRAVGKGSQEDVGSKMLVNGRHVKLGIDNTKQMVIFFFYFKLHLDPKSRDRISSSSSYLWRSCKTERALEKHLSAVYICRCGHRGRKDKHQDYLRENNCSGQSACQCICGRISY